jgi:hypothetical protein
VRAAPILHDAGLQCLLGSVAGGAVFDRLRGAREIQDRAPGARDLLDGVCFHPYHKSAHDLETDDVDRPRTLVTYAVIKAYREVNPERNAEAPELDPDPALLKNLPVWVTEFGWALADEVDLEGQADALESGFTSLLELPRDTLATACYYAWRSKSKNGYALREWDEPLDGRPRRPAWHRFAAVAQAPGLDGLR